MKIPCFTRRNSPRGLRFITTTKEKESIAMDIGELSARAAMVEKTKRLAAELEAIKRITEKYEPTPRPTHPALGRDARDKRRGPRKRNTT